MAEDGPAGADEEDGMGSEEVEATLFPDCGVAGSGIAVADTLRGCWASCDARGGDRGRSAVGVSARSRVVTATPWETSI